MVRKMKKDTILLTGASGYLGGILGDTLLKQGYSIIPVYRNHNSKCNFDNGVYLSDDNLENIFKNQKFDGVIHTATAYGRNKESLSEIINSNVVFPAELIQLAAKYKIKYFINTDTILNKYISAYSLTKSHVTDWMQMYSSDVKMINMKLDHFYGPKDSNTKFVAAMLEKLLNNVPQIDLTEGTQTRDFIYIDDVVNAYMVILSNIDKIPSGHISSFEVGTNKKTSIRQLMLMLKNLTGAQTKLNFGAVPYRRNEILDYDVNTTALRLLGWTPKVNVEQGLKNIVEQARGQR